MKLRSLLFVLALLGLFAAPDAAFAHSRLVKSMPAAGATVMKSPAVIQLWFSEAPDARLTTVAITGADGSAVKLGAVEAVPDSALTLRVAVTGVLAPGTYKVAWRAVAADDGHPSSGSYTFTVDSASGVAAAVAGAANATVASAPVARIHVDSVPVQTAVLGSGAESPVYIVARWLGFLGLIGTLGAVALRLYVVPRVAGATDPVVAELTPDIARFGWIASWVMLLAALGRLVAEHAVMAATVNIGLLDVVLRTEWGNAWLMQLAAAIVTVGALWFARRGAFAGWMVASVAVDVFVVLIALASHAASARQWGVAGIAIDALHVYAAGAWLGTLCALVFVAGRGAPRPSERNGESGGALGLVSRMVNAFSPVALTFASVVVITGALSAWLELGSLSALWTTEYGTVLIVKLVLVACVIAAGAFNMLRMRGELSSAAAGDGTGGAARRFGRSARVELVFGVAVIAVTAVLVAMPTPRG